MAFDIKHHWPESQNHLTVQNIRLVPILHGRMEFASEVRRQFYEFKPTAVAIELPDTLSEPVITALRKLPFISVVHFVTSKNEPAYLPIEPTDGVMEAGRLALEAGIELHFVDRDTDAIELLPERLPDPHAISRIGWAAYCREALKHWPFGPRSAEDPLREQTMAHHLQQLQKQAERILFVCGLSHIPAVLELLSTPQAMPIGRLKRRKIQISAMHPDSIRECLAEPPYLASAYEEARRAAHLENLDRTKTAIHMLQKARAEYKKNEDEEVSPGALKTLFRFARNYALVEGGLAPDFYQLLVAAKSCINDNFAYEVWETATNYPYIESPPSMPYLRISIEDLYKHARYIRFHRKLKQRRENILRMIKRRKKEKTPGEWKQKWDGSSICSYPPEDLVVEGYGTFLRKKAIGILSEEQSRIEAFSTSLLDGVDMRETLRNWHEKKLYVRESRKIQGQVGAVVLIFDEDAGAEEKYPWTMTWQGEHEQESDMALYSTEPGEKVIGPGISRCEYGGMVMSYPPGRMFFVWEDPTFDTARNKAERLLLAGLFYAEDRIVVYVAEKPPREQMRTIAARLDKKLQYIPIGQLSPLTLKKVKTFHVLDGHRVRLYATEYIY